MTEQNKLRKFKLINCKGFKDEIIAYCGIQYLHENYLHIRQGMVIEGISNSNGGLISESFGTGGVTKTELSRYFEEVFDEEEDDTVKTFTYGNQEYLVVAPHPTQEGCTIVIKTSDNHIDVFTNEFVEKLMKPRSWQEQLCEEFDMSYVEKGDQFVQGSLHSTKDMVAMAKRILELSGE